MKVPIEIDGATIEAELEHTIIYEETENGKVPVEVYRGRVKSPKTFKNYIATFNPKTGEITIEEVR